MIFLMITVTSNIAITIPQLTFLLLQLALLNILLILLTSLSLLQLLFFAIIIITSNTDTVANAVIIIFTASP